MGATRDFEGVGGWRLGDDDDDDTMWTKFNTRLELPADHGRRHHRSLTAEMRLGNSTSYSPETVMNSSRARTPPSGAAVGEGYFPRVEVSPRVLNKTASVLAGNSGSSGSCKGSSMMSMKQK